MYADSRTTARREPEWLGRCGLCDGSNSLRFPSNSCLKLFCSFLGVAGTIAVMVFGCAQPRISKHSAIQAANRAADSAGIRLAEYKEPKAEFLRPSGLD